MKVRFFFALISSIMMALIVATSLNSIIFSEGVDFDDYGKIYTLEITNNEDYYAIINADGDKISVNGKFANDFPVDVYIYSAASSQKSKNDLTVRNNANFSATLSLAPLQPVIGNLFICLNSGNVLHYPIWYDMQVGWFFPDNGLNVANLEKFDNIIVTPDLAGCYYVSATADLDEIESTINQLNSIVNSVTNNEDSDYLKTLKLCDWVADNIYYDHTASVTSVTMETIAIYNVLNTKRTVCGGYANLYCALLEAAGIKSVNLKGSATSGEVVYDSLLTGVENHEWCAFYYEEEERWVYVDVCWNSNNDYKNDEFVSNISDRMYFDPSDDAFAFSHRVDKVEQRNYLGSYDVAATMSPQEYSRAEEAIISAESTSAEVTTIPSEETVDRRKPVTTAKNIVKSDSDKATGTTDSSEVALNVGAIVVAVACAGAIIYLITKIISLK